jgi:hypothetical protein
MDLGNGERKWERNNQKDRTSDFRNYIILKNHG